MSTPDEKTAALIPAAGLSSRMKRFKPLLWLNGRTFIECAIDTFKQAGISNIIVVTGHRSGELEPVIRKTGAVAVFNPDYQNDMFSSVLTGIRHLPDVPAFFVLPADIPLVRPATVCRILDAYKACPTDILYPVYRGKRGHPILISKELTRHILSWDGDGGLRKCLEKFKRRTREIEVADRGVLMDADRPVDYEKLLEQSAFQNIPSAEECLELLQTVDSEGKSIIRDKIETQPAGPWKRS